MNATDPHRRRSVTVVVLLAGLVSLLTSCTGVPSRSPARVADSLPIDNGPPERLSIPFRVVKPEHGDSPREIVDGYLAAQANPERNHGLARQFLSPTAATGWDDSAASRVIKASPYIKAASPTNKVMLDAQQIGTIMTDGSYLAAVKPYSFPFELVKVDGDWRINNPPAGVIVNDDDFQNVYRAYNLYYLDPAEKHVIPDPRYFAATSTSSATSRATSFLRLLGAGPSPTLGAAVQSELVEGVNLAGNVRQDSDRVLGVYLTGLGAKAPVARGAAVAQIVWTLSQLSPSGIKIFDDDQLLELPGVSQPTQQSEWQSFDPDALPLNTTAYFVRDGALYTMDGTRTEGPAGEGHYGLSSVAVSLTDEAHPKPRLAGVNVVNGLSTMYVGQLDGDLDPRLTSRSLTSPTWDSTSDEVWVLRDEKSIVRVPQRGTPAVVDTQSLDSVGALRVLRLSRDSTRVAIVAGSPARLYIGRVIRNNGQVTIEEPVPIAPALSQVYDVAWSSATTLMVLARSAGDDRALESVSVDGATMKPPESKVGLPGPPTAVAAAPTHVSIVESERLLWERTGNRWTNLVRGSTVAGHAPVYPD